MSRAREEGVVLLLVLVVIVLTISSVFAFARTSLLEVMSIRQRADRVRAQMLARSGYTVALLALEDDLAAPPDELAAVAETPLDAWYLVGQAPIPAPDGGEIRLTIRDTGSRINLNGLVDEDGAPYPESRDFLRAALERIIEDMPGRPEEKIYEPDEIADALLDWLDADEEGRLGDAESRLYGKIEGAPLPLDRPIFDLGELSGVPGIDARLLDALGEYFTTQPLFVPIERAGVNPNTAPPHVLGLIYFGGAIEENRLLAQDREDVFRALRARSEGLIFCEAQHPECVGFAPEVIPLGDATFPPLTYTSDVFRIESEGRYGVARARIVAVVDRGQAGGARTLYYRSD
jgi:type II secretory pathway component PulK